MELKDVVAAVVSLGVLAFGGVVGNLASDLVKKGWAALQLRQRTAAQRQGSDIEGKALELAVDNQQLLVWIGGTLMAMLTVAMLVLAELFLVLAMLNPTSSTWGCWLGAMLAGAAAWLGYRFYGVLDKVQDALNTAPTAAA